MSYEIWLTGKGKKKSFSLFFLDFIISSFMLLQSSETVPVNSTRDPAGWIFCLFSQHLHFGYMDSIKDFIEDIFYKQS